MKLPISLVIILTVSSGVLAHADVTSITLDTLPESVHVEDVVVFSGVLLHGTEPMANQTVKIFEDDPFIPDDLLATTVTDPNGRFSVEWIAEAGLFEREFDLYASFADDEHGTRSNNQEMGVYRYSGTITLNLLPADIPEGDVVMFEGTLQVDEHSNLKKELNHTLSDVVIAGFLMRIHHMLCQYSSF